MFILKKIVNLWNYIRNFLGEVSDLERSISSTRPHTVNLSTEYEHNSGLNVSVISGKNMRFGSRSEEPNATADVISSTSSTIQTSDDGNIA